MEEVCWWDTGQRARHYCDTTSSGWRHKQGWCKVLTVLVHAAPRYFTLIGKQLLQLQCPDPRINHRLC